MGEKRYLSIDVYEAARDRFREIFDSSGTVLVAFSGGKDSGVILNMAYDCARELGRLDDLAMFHLDYEAQYQATTNYVTYSFMDDFPGIRKYWLCLPLSAQCACRMDGDSWIPWEDGAEWVRDMPDNQYVINPSNTPPWFKKGMKDYRVQEKFCRAFADQQEGKTTVVIGIRADESLSRYAAIKGSHKLCGDGYIRPAAPNLDNAYPIYDWAASDVWVYNARYGKVYNRLYDLFYIAGVPIDKMRVASPWNNCALGSLSLYKKIDPDSWDRMARRVAGNGMAAIYGGTAVLGYGGITKPDGMTWQDYCNYLLGTMEPELREHYLDKFSGRDDYQQFCKCILKNDYGCYSLRSAGSDKKREMARKWRDRL